MCKLGAFFFADFPCGNRETCSSAHQTKQKRSIFENLLIRSNTNRWNKFNYVHSIIPYRQWIEHYFIDNVTFVEYELNDFVHWIVFIHLSSYLSTWLQLCCCLTISWDEDLLLFFFSHGAHFFGNFKINMQTNEIEKFHIFKWNKSRNTTSMHTVYGIGRLKYVERV